MKKWAQKVFDHDPPEYFNFSKEYLSAQNGLEKMNVLIKFGIICPEWRGEVSLNALRS